MNSGPDEHTKKLSSRTVIKYSLIQLIDLVVLVIFLLIIRRWFDIPTWLFWSLIILFIAKDIVLYPFLWRSYVSDKVSLVHPMVGSIGTVHQTLNPDGLVKIRGELWQAEAFGITIPIQTGEEVIVQQVEGLKLLVTRATPYSDNDNG